MRKFGVGIIHLKIIMEREKFDHYTAIIITIATLILIIILIVLSVKFFANIKEIKTDSLVYGLEKHNFTNCNCYDPQGRVWNIKDNGFVTEGGSFILDLEG